MHDHIAAKDLNILLHHYKRSFFKGDLYAIVVLKQNCHNATLLLIFSQFYKPVTGMRGQFRPVICVSSTVTLFGKHRCFVERSNGRGPLYGFTEERILGGSERFVHFSALTCSVTK